MELCHTIFTTQMLIQDTSNILGCCHLQQELQYQSLSEAEQLRFNPDCIFGQGTFAGVMWYLQDR